MSLRYSVLTYCKFTKMPKMPHGVYISYLYIYEMTIWRLYIEWCFMQLPSNLDILIASLLRAICIKSRMHIFLFKYPIISRMFFPVFLLLHDSILEVILLGYFQISQSVCIACKGNRYFYFQLVKYVQNKNLNEIFYYTKFILDI